MRILQITKKVPFPYHDGESWAVKALAEGLASQCELHLLALNTDKHFVDEEDLKTLRSSSLYHSVNTIDINTKADSISAIINIVNGKSYHIQRYDQSEIHVQLKQHLDSLESVDVVILESLFVMPNLNTVRASWPDVFIVYRAHNVEHEIWQRITREVSPMAQWYFKNQSQRLKKYEKKSLKTPDLTVTVSERDKFSLLKLNRQIDIIAVPIGINAKPRDEANSDSKVLKIGFIGSLDWRPNLHGLKRFLQFIWPHVLSDNIEIHIAGRGSESIKSNKENIINHGIVASSEDFLKQLDLSIVPLWSGSGTRVKILEAMSYGVPVLSTAIGAEGLALEKDETILIADSEEDWITTLNNLKGDRTKLKTIEKSALSIIQEKHDIGLLGEKLLHHIYRLQNV